MKIKDRVVLATSVGLISAFFGKGSALIVKIFYPPTLNMADIFAPIFFTKTQAHTIPGLIFSYSFSLTVGIVYSFMYLLVLDTTGWRYFWLKSFFVTSFGFLVLGGLLDRLLNLVPIGTYPLWIPIIIYLAHMVLMASQTILVKMWGEPKNNTIG